MLLRPAVSTQASFISSLFRQPLNLVANSCLSRILLVYIIQNLSFCLKAVLNPPPLNYAVQHHPVNQNPTSSNIHLSNVSILMTLPLIERRRESEHLLIKWCYFPPPLFRNQIFLYTSTIHSVCLPAFVEQWYSETLSLMFFCPFRRISIEATRSVVTGRDLFSLDSSRS